MLTDPQIKKAIAIASAETTLNDSSGGHGSGSLKLRIRPGAKTTSATWIAAWKQDGQRAFKPLGAYPNVSAAQARAAYQADIVPLLLAGKDPRVAVAAEGKPTVARMFEAYVENMREKGRASAGEVARVLLAAECNAADTIGRNRLAKDIDPADVAAFVSKFYRKGNRGAADKARSYVSAAFNWAIHATFDYTAKSRQDWGVKSNPASAVKRDQEAIKHRDRNLTEGELRMLWADAHEGTKDFTLETAGAIRLLICCGQRVQETLRIDGCEIDLDAGLWRMPAPKTKGKLRPHTIPLPSQALAILRPLIERHGDGPLFPSRTGSKGALIDHRSIKQVIDRWNVGRMPVFQTRDLRRTWKSRAGEAGMSKEVRDIIQQHTARDIGSKAYDRSDYLPAMRQAMKSWELWLDRNVIAQPEKAVA